METQLELHQLSLDMVLRLELEIGEMRRKLGQSYGVVVPRSVFKKEQRRLRSNHRARMRALKGHKERERAMRVLEWSKMSTAPTNADQRSTGQTPGLHPVLLLPVNGAPQGEDDLSQDKAASPISGGAAEDLFDDQEDDSASEYDDALSWFNEADVLWTKEQLAAAGTPMASTSEEAAENMIREPMVSVERDGERPWYAKIEPEDYHGLPHHDVASIIIEEESEEEEETCVLESLPGTSV
ncbi:hypothetical protein BKA70DRAFT_840752 [Coprinopsis sp. MPI-PUGE-AT-0042]|nr:hypothetical protein BKA70DRAFT_840752 [Coprinopsis sp. MPI-PUGE-AT-0042]